MEWSEMDFVDRLVEIAWWLFFALVVAPLVSLLCAILLMLGTGELLGIRLEFDFLSVLATVGPIGSLLALGLFFWKLASSKRRSPAGVLKPSDLAHPDHNLWANREGPYADE